MIYSSLLKSGLPLCSFPQVKNPLANRCEFCPWIEKIPKKMTTPQHAYMENPMDRGTSIGLQSMGLQKSDRTE